MLICLAQKQQKKNTKQLADVDARTNKRTTEESLKKERDILALVWGISKKVYSKAKYNTIYTNMYIIR